MLIIFHLGSLCSRNGIPVREVAPSWSRNEFWEEAFITSKNFSPWLPIIFSKIHDYICEVCNELSHYQHRIWSWLFTVAQITYSQLSFLKWRRRRRERLTCDQPSSFSLLPRLVMTELNEEDFYFSAVSSLLFILHFDLQTTLIFSLQPVTCTTG